MSENIIVPQPNMGSHVESSLVRDSTKPNGVNNAINKTGIKKIQAKELKGGIKKKELTFKEKLKRSFVKEDIHDIRDYIIFDMIIPNARKAFFDTIVGTAAQIFGISVPRGGYSNGYSPANVRLTPHERQYRDYNSISQSRLDRGSSGNRILTYDRFYVSDYPFTYKEDAENTLEQLMDICDTYGWVSVAKFFEIADPEGTIEGRNVYTNNDFGWRAIDNARVTETPDGYVIVLPPARAIKNRL